jgi:hypothetical protein
MKVEKIKNVDIKLIDGNSYYYETPDNLLKAHQNMIFVGKRNSGKSQSCCNYLKLSKFHRIFVISSTFDSNKKLMNVLNISENDVFHPDMGALAIENIIYLAEKERDAYVRYHEMLKKHNLLMYYIKSNTHIEQIPLELMNEYDELIQKPIHKYNGERPYLALWIDDCQSTKLYRVPEFLNFITRHRHIASFEEGGALGLSIFQCIQNYKSQFGGCPRAVKNNATSLAIFKIKDEAEKKEIFDSVAGELTYDNFNDAYEYATKEPYSFLLIDLHPKTGYTYFRKCFNELIRF